MLKKIKISLASKKVKEKAQEAKKKNFWDIILWPFRAFACLCKNTWHMICGINLIGLINITLLSAIIVLFSMLIIEITGCRDKTIIVSTADAIIEDKTPVKTPTEIKKVVITLPLKRNEKGEILAKKELKKETIDNTQKENKQKDTTMYGDTIIDGANPDARLSYGSVVKGNLYLQNMRRYSLPCNVRIEGDLFMRNVSMLKFCGEFTVTGNIYVSPNSSFGPIPYNARLGGQVIL